MTSASGDSKFIEKLTQRSTTFMLKTSLNAKVLEAKLKLEDRKSTRLNSSHSGESRMPSSA